MKALVQRVSSARVVVEGKEAGRIGAGLLVFLGVAKGDGPGEADRLARKVVEARVFEGEKGHFHFSLQDVGGSLLVVSQFTLCARTRKGRRPSLDDAAPPAQARGLYERFQEACRALGVPVETGVFGAHMEVHLVNDGPVTFLFEIPPARKDS